jgi:hypothetical protein
MQQRPGLGPGRSFEELWMSVIETRNATFGDWSASVEAWIDRETTTAVVRFEDLRLDPQGVARDALSGIGVEVGQPRDRMQTLEEMRAADPTVVRSGRIGDWREEMPERAIERFAELHGEVLVRLAYESSPDPSEWARSLEAEG